MPLAHSDYANGDETQLASQTDCLTRASNGHEEGQRSHAKQELLAR
jgi:hypothetical protein